MADLETIGVKAIVEGAASYISDLNKMAAAEKSTAADAKSLETASKNAGKGLDAAGQAAGNAQKPLKSLDDQAAQTAKTMKQFDTAVTALSLGALAGFAGGAVYAVKQAASFEHQINILGAVSGASADQLGQVQTKAKELGADLTLPGTSASDAAGAMTELAKAGFTVEQAMNASKGVLQLSAAAQIDNARAAEIASNALNAFKLPAENAVHVSDLLAGAANASSAEIDQVADSLQQSAAVYASAGISIEDLTTAIAEMANAGIKGSDAGTSLKTMLLALESPSNKAKDAMEELGINIYDANGKMIPFKDIIGQVSGAVTGLTQQQRDQALATIFGSDAIRSANIVLAAGVKPFEDLAGAVNKQGAAADLANAQMQGLSGSWEGFKSQMQTVATDIGERALPVLTNLTTQAANLLGTFDNLPASTQNLIIMSGVLAALAGPAYNAIAKVVTVMLNLEKASNGTKVAIGAIGLGALAIGVDALLQKTTGAGLIDHVFGDVASIEAHAAAIGHLNAAILASGPTADKLALATQSVANAQSQLAAAGGEAIGSQNAFQNALLGSDNRIFGFDVGLSDGIDTLKEFKEQVAVGGEEMLKNGATVGQLKAVYDTLSPALQQVFDAHTHVTEAIELQKESVAGQTYQLAAMSGTAAELAGQLRATALGITSTADAEPQARDALAEWTDTVETAKDGTKEFQKAIDTLIHTFADTNPVVVALSAENAKLQERIDQIKGSTDSLSASQQAQVDSIQAQIDANNAAIQPMADNQKAMEGQQQAAQNLLGPDGYGALLNKLQDLKIPQEDQIALQGHLSDAYLSLATNDIPTAVSAFQDLAAHLDPKIWAVLGQSAGPALMDAIKTSYTGPDKDALIAATQALIDKATEDSKATATAGGQELGANIADGVAAGVQSRVANAMAAVKAMVYSLLGAGQTAAQSKSPSRLFADQLGEPITQGVMVGMLSAEPELLRTMTNVIEDVADEGDSAQRTILIPAVNNWGDDAIRTYQKKLSDLRTTLLNNLDSNTQMSDDEVKQMFATIIDTVNAAPLTPAFVSAIDSAVAAMVTSLAAGKGVANAQVADLIASILVQVANGSAQIQQATSKLAGSATGGGGGGGFNGSVPQGGFAEPGGPASQGPQAGTTYKYASDVPGSTNGELPGVPGFDWVWVPGVGYHLETKSYGESPQTSGAGLGHVEGKGAVDPYNHPGLVWDGSKWVTPQAYTGYASPLTYSQAVAASQYYIDPNTGKALPKDQYVWDPKTRTYVLKAGASSGSFAIGALNIPYDGDYRLHKDETVVPKNVSAQFLFRLLQNHGIGASRWASMLGTFESLEGGDRRGGNQITRAISYPETAELPRAYTSATSSAIMPSISLDLRGSTFSGSPEENAAAIDVKIRNSVAMMFGQDAFISGAKTTW